MLKKGFLLIILLLLGVSLGWLLRGMTLHEGKVSALLDNTSEENVNDYSGVYNSTFKRAGQVFYREPLSEDLTGDGKPELIFTTVGEGCASCHAKNIYIFQEEKELLKLESNDPFFHALPGRGFLVVEPLGEENEGTCCPTAYQNTLYLWDGQIFKKK